MKELMENSVKLSGHTVVCWPQHDDQEETLDMSDTGSKFNGCYAMNNSTICFIVNDEIFVTPYTREAMSTIMDAGLVKEHFYVPFSNWDYPKYEKAKWEHLRLLAHESLYRDYEADSAKWCDEHGIGKLNDETLERCFKIPLSGVPVKHPYYKDIVRPATDEFSVDCTVVEKLGRFCTNNGKVVFVYHDGHTYVTKGYWILDELRRAGYEESSLFVPFSNGEQITDPYLASQWEQISKK